MIFFQANTNPVHALAFSPDGALLAAGDLFGVVRIWDTATGKALITFEHSSARGIHGISAICFHPDGKSIWAKGGSDVTRWSLKPMQRSGQGGGLNRLVGRLFRREWARVVHNGVFTFALSPDGIMRAVVPWQYDRLPQEIQCWRGSRMLWKSEFWCPQALAFSPDSEQLAGSNNRHEARVWHALSGVQQYQLHGKGKAAIRLPFRRTAAVWPGPAFGG
jgi:WD40 repeat protein